MLIGLVAYAKADKELGNNPELARLVEGITGDDEWSRIFEDRVVEGSDD